MRQNANFHHQPLLSSAGSKPHKYSSTRNFGVDAYLATFLHRTPRHREVNSLVMSMMYVRIDEQVATRLYERARRNRRRPQDEAAIILEDVLGRGTGDSGNREVAGSNRTPLRIVKDVGEQAPEADKNGGGETA